MHGCIVRINIFLGAYFKYRNSASEDTELTKEELSLKFKQEEKFVIEILDNFSSHIDAHWTRYSKVSEALFVKTVRQTIAKNCRFVVQEPEYIEAQITNFSKKLEVI